MSDLLGYIGVVAFGWLMVFQLCLAAGLPLGALAWGGAHTVLPRGLRLASLASFMLAFWGGTSLGQSLELWQLWPERSITPAMIGLTALFALSLVGNVMTRSRIERLHGVPLVLMLLLGCASQLI